jgi:hypothetical protein
MKQALQPVTDARVWLVARRQTIKIGGKKKEMLYCMTQQRNIIIIIIIIIYLLQLGLHPVAVVLTLHNYIIMIIIFKHLCIVVRYP